MPEQAKYGGYSDRCHLNWRRSDNAIRDKKKTLMTMKNERASGPKGVPIELIKNGPDILMQLLEYVFNCFTGGEEWPHEWKTVYSSNLYKKGDRKQCFNYKGLNIINSFSSLCGKISKNRKYEEEEEQSRFRVGRSCPDNLFCLKQLGTRRMTGQKSRDWHNL